MSQKVDTDKSFSYNTRLRYHVLTTHTMTENQLLATYYMTLCDMRERSFTQKHRECVRVVNGDIGKMIRTTGTVVPAPPVSAPPAPAPPVPAPPDPAPPVPAPPDTSDALHSWFQVGHRHKVHVTDTLKGYCEFKDNLGIICRIVKAPHFLVCVRLDDFVLRVQG